MSLSSSFLDDLKSRLALADVIGKSVKLTRRGRQFLGLCPFHGEKTPSFHVYDDHFHCFGCGAHGSLIDFVMQRDKVGFREAVERLAAVAGVSLPSESPEAAERDRRRQSLHEVLEAAAVYYQGMLRMPEGAAALAYLRRRGVGDDAIARFRLGYAPSGRFAVKAALARDGFTDEAMIEAGLVIRPEEATADGYDRFRDRVTFPIADRRGRIVGFGGRLLGPGEPKYLNTPETPLFHKGSLLYNLDRAVQPARERGTVIVVEGYMDVIGLAEAGYDHVVAPLGTALTEDQIQLLWRLAPEPVLLFDPDAAGERAALRAAERAMPLMKPGLGLRFAFLATETGDDPDAVARRYPKQFLERTLSEALSLSDMLFRAETRGRRTTTGEERAALDDRLKRRAATIGDAAVRAHVLSAFRRRLWQRGGPQAEGVVRPAAPAGGGDAEGGGAKARADAERILIAIVLNHPGFFEEIEDELGALNCTDEALDRLRQGMVLLLSGQAVAPRQRHARRLAGGPRPRRYAGPPVRRSLDPLAPPDRAVGRHRAGARNLGGERRGGTPAGRARLPDQPKAPAGKAQAPGALARRAARARRIR